MKHIKKRIRVTNVLSPSQVILNIGSRDGVSENDEFIIYGLSEDEIIDPDTGKSLGHFEHYRGVGIVEQVQGTMCILNALPANRFGPFKLVANSISGIFNNPQIGDYAKPNATKIR